MEESDLFTFDMETVRCMGFSTCPGLQLHTCRLCGVVTERICLRGTVEDGRFLSRSVEPMEPRKTLERL